MDLRFKEAYGFEIASIKGEIGKLALEFRKNPSPSGLTNIFDCAQRAREAYDVALSMSSPSARLAIYYDRAIVMESINALIRQSMRRFGK